MPSTSAGCASSSSTRADEMLRMDHEDALRRLRPPSPRSGSRRCSPPTCRTRSPASPPPTSVTPSGSRSPRPPPPWRTPSSSTPSCSFRFKVEALASRPVRPGARRRPVFVRTRSTAEEVATALPPAACVPPPSPETSPKRNGSGSSSGSAMARSTCSWPPTWPPGAPRTWNASDSSSTSTYPGRRGLRAPHRSRTGRAGRKGKALAFFTPKEMSRLRTIERATHTQAHRGDGPLASGRGGPPHPAGPAHPPRG